LGNPSLVPQAEFTLDRDEAIFALEELVSEQPTNPELHVKSRPRCPTAIPSGFIAARLVRIYASTARQDFGPVVVAGGARASRHAQLDRHGLLRVCDRWIPREDILDLARAKQLPDPIV